MLNDSILTKEKIDQFKRDFQKTPNRQVLKHAIIKNGIKAVSLNNDVVINMQHTFSEEIKTGKATDQDSTGRCWLFAGLNTLRQKIADEYKIKDFELSQNYPMFWDKLEKANYFFENIIETVEDDIYSRIIMWLLYNPVQDGGQWDMFSNLIEKYGIVPKYMMPETFHSSKSHIMNRLLTLKLRENASILRKLFRDGKDIKILKEKKSEMLNEIYGMLVFFLGEPPTKFHFEYRDKDKNFHQDLNLTPQEFFQTYININLNDYASIINAPTEDKPYKKTYTVKYLGNVKGGKDVLYLNVDNKTLKQLTLSQLKENIPVWFGCDVGQMMDSDQGIMDTELFLYEDALGTSFNLDKAGRLDYGESLLTHAMVFTGVNLVDGKPNRWKVENSWGDKSGKDGYFVMGDKWFDEFNYQIVVHKKFLSDELKQSLAQKPVVLPPWDPMGALALMR